MVATKNNLELKKGLHKTLCPKIQVSWHKLDLESGLVNVPGNFEELAMVKRKNHPPKDFYEPVYSSLQIRTHFKKRKAWRPHKDRASPDFGVLAKRGTLAKTFLQVTWEAPIIYDAQKRSAHTAKL